MRTFTLLLITSLFALLSFSQNKKTIAYIDQWKEVAQENQAQHNIPASITLAQAIIESGSGSSKIAIEANNHFGIRASEQWKGEKYCGNPSAKKSCFRKYTSANDSFRDHSLLLKNKRYAFLLELEVTDYKNWAKGLQKAGYAKHPKYAQLLIDTIEKYHLHQYDMDSSSLQDTIKE